jgi:hypothetical protein
MVPGDFASVIAVSCCECKQLQHDHKSKGKSDITDNVNAGDDVI